MATLPECPRAKRPKMSQHDQEAADPIQEDDADDTISGSSVVLARDAKHLVVTVVLATIYALF